VAALDSGLAEGETGKPVLLVDAAAMALKHYQSWGTFQNAIRSKSGILTLDRESADYRDRFQRQAEWLGQVQEGVPTEDSFGPLDQGVPPGQILDLVAGLSDAVLSALSRFNGAPVLPEARPVPGRGHPAKARGDLSA
jgi:hypothetical protein